ncbi:MAG: adenylate/guanylate cyclase domain-containing protein [Candidatus Binatia bacterium]
MRVRDGTVGQKSVFALLVGLALLGLGLAVVDKLERYGQPNVGFMMDESYVSPTRRDASESGLRGGGQALRINDIAVHEGASMRALVPWVRREIGATNRLTILTPTGDERELIIPVTAWTTHDFLFTQGGSDVIGLLWIIVGVAAFALRPYEIGSWAQLSLASFAGGALLTTFIPYEHRLAAIYFLIVVGFLPFVPLHAALAFPVVHRVLLQPATVWVIYGLGAANAGVNLLGWSRGFDGVFAYTRGIGSAMTLVSIATFIGRSLQMALHSQDPLVAQRGRILLGGAVIGLTPFGIVQFTREAFGALPIDNRFLMWPLAVFVLALGRVTVRQELLNARIAVRRAVLYAGAVGILTVIALLLIWVRPYAVAVLLFPLLYVWPRFEARLNRRLYPQRARFPELLRAAGGELAAAQTVDGVLDVLAETPGRLCDATQSVAVVFASEPGGVEHVRATNGPRPADGGALADEPLLLLMRATRKEILRDRIAVEPQYANVMRECHAGFERLGAELLLPLEHEQRVIGALAVGPRATGDVYEGAEIDALSSAAQQAVQALMRVVATEKLRAREREFADLKRFFPPQIIDQVMAQGGAAELRSQRKIVTVVFADLRGFTAFSDGVEPEEVMATLNEYHAAVGQRIAEQAGTLEHFAGDGFMVFFNDPVDQPDHAERAVSMARAMRSDVERLRQNWLRKGYQIHIGIGVHTGYATCGFVGYEGRRDYSVIGNTTNLAARLSDAAAPGEILLSARVQSELGHHHAVEPAGELSLKGFHQTYAAFRLL